MPDGRPDSEYVYRARLLGVVDGDTLDFEIDQGFRHRHTIRVRLKGVDTAETYGVKKESDEYARGQEHKQFTSDWLVEAVRQVEERFPLRVRTWKDETGKYGRYLADVYRQTQVGEVAWDASLVSALIDEYPEVTVDG